MCGYFVHRRATRFPLVSHRRAIMMFVRGGRRTMRIVVPDPEILDVDR